MAKGKKRACVYNGKEFPSQAALAKYVGIHPVILSKYMTKHNHDAEAAMSAYYKDQEDKDYRKYAKQKAIEENKKKDEGVTFPFVKNIEKLTNKFLRTMNLNRKM